MKEIQIEPPASNRRVPGTSHPLVAAAWQQVLALATMMTLVAGFVDAVGYVNLGQLYLSFMSGNTTRFGMALAAGDDGVVVRGTAIIAMFVLGAFVGSLLSFCGGAHKLSIVLGSEILCFGAAYGLSTFAAGRFALLPIALAMGMQNAIHQAVSGADTGKSFITGTLFGVGDALAQVVIGRGHYAQAAVHAASWLAFAGGVVLGALSLSRFGLDRALFMAIGVLAVMAIAALPRRS